MGVVESRDGQGGAGRGREGRGVRGVDDGQGGGLG